MSQQNEPMNIAVAADVPLKRKRGRPRKDESTVKKEKLNLPATPASDGTRTIQPEKISPSIPVERGMVGMMISGVIEGTFDAGYLISVRVGDSNTLLRGVVFQPGQVKPITPANDVAPHATLCTRRELPVPAFNPQSQVNGSVQPFQFENQPPKASMVVPPTSMPETDSGANSSRGKITMQKTPESAPPSKNLKLVEQDEFMQVFEVSTQSGPKVDARAAKSALPDLHQKGNIDQVPQAEKAAADSELKPDDLVPEKLELQQSPIVAVPQSAERGLKPCDLVQNEPVTDKPQSVYPEPIIEPMDVVIEKPASPKNDTTSVPLKENSWDGRSELGGKVLQNDETCQNKKPVEAATTVLQEVSWKSGSVQPELGDKVLRTDETCQSRKPVSDASENAEVEGSESVPRTVEEGLPSEPDLQLAPEQERQIPDTSVGHTSNADMVLEDVITPASNVLETAN